MTKATLQVSLYPLATSLTTGHVADFFRTLRGVEWRMEVWDGQPPKFFKGETLIPWEDCPKGIKIYAQSAIDWLNAARKP